ncbi:ABC transporter permease [Luteimonas sp. BDR2-5]|uniref:ABC transporter permease n=1 Tax=Proluteimonas luteida TaxID=2878685 RepID=UPI001E31893E|nr:ABC transporter permease [Luteimonas sp. BDR2-5]MCD9027494.1 ABC transporter permease [Luteimonas sp. BDR2-5]
MAAGLTGWGEALLAATRRELGRLRRDRWDLALVTWLPWGLLLVLALLMGDGVMRDLPIAVVDQDRSAESRELVRMLDASPGLEVVAAPLSLEAAWPLVRKLDVFAVVHIPPRAAREVARGQAGTLLAYYNASYLTAGQSAARDIGDVVDAFNRDVVVSSVALAAGPATVRDAPVAVQARVLFNPERNLGRFLLGLLVPALLLLAAMLAMTTSLGRELRDGSLAAWLAPQRWPSAAVLGKLLPYLLLFTSYGVVGVLLSAWRAGDAFGNAGGMLALLAGIVLLYAAYASVSLLLVGLTRDLGTSLSICSLYAGTVMAFAGATFPINDGSRFLHVWNAILPFTHFVVLQARTLDMGGAAGTSLAPLLALAAFLPLAGVPGYWLYRRAARRAAAGAAA